MGQNKSLPLVLSRKARDDLDAIWRYSFETWGIEQADKYVDSFDSSFATLCEMPEISRLRREFRNPTRIYRSGEHLIFYRVEDDALIVLRILHQRRNWQILFDK